MASNLFKFYNTSIQLRKIIFNRLKECNIKIYDFLRELHINPELFIHWYRYGISHRYVYKTRSMSEEQINELLDFLAISVNVISVNNKDKFIILVEDISKCKTITSKKHLNIFIKDMSKMYHLKRKAYGNKKMKALE